MMQAPNYELSSYTPAQLLLPSYINSCAEETIKFINYNWRGLLRIISWDDANIPIGPNLTLLPVFQDGGGGLCKRPVDTADREPRRYTDLHCA